MTAACGGAYGIGCCRLWQGWWRQHRTRMGGGGGALGCDGGCSEWERGGGGVGSAAENVEHGHTPCSKNFHAPNLGTFMFPC